MNDCQHFAELLIYIGDQESKIEQIRLHLVQNEYFTLSRAYQAIDTQNTNYIQSDMIAKLLNCSKQDADKLLAYYSEYKQQQITFAQFIHVCLPRSDTQLRQQLVQKLNKNLGSPEEQAVLLQHLSVLLDQEVKLFQRLNKYTQIFQINIDNVYKEMTMSHPKLTQPILNQFLLQLGYNVNIDPIWKRLDFRQTGDVSLQDLQHLFNPMEQIRKHHEYISSEDVDVQVPLKLGWISKSGCPYHKYSKEIREKITDFNQFIRTRQTLRQQEINQLVLLFKLCKEQSSINQQIDSLLYRLHSRQDFELSKLFDLISINGVLEEEHLGQSLQNILGQQFNIELQDVTSLLKYFKGNDFNSFSNAMTPRMVPQLKKSQTNGMSSNTMDVIRIVIIKILLLFKLSSYLRRQYRKKSLIRDQDILAEFSTTNEITQSQFLTLARKLKVNFSVAEVEYLFIGLVLTMVEFLNFLNDV